MASTELSVAEAVKVCVRLVDTWGQEAFKTKDEQRFCALIKQCAEQLLEKREVRDEYSREKKEVWVVKEMHRNERSEKVRGDVLLWLTEARGLIPTDKWYSLKVYFENLWTHVQVFCGHEAVQKARAAVAVAAVEVEQRGETEAMRNEKLLALMQQLKELVFAFQRELGGDA